MPPVPTKKPTPTSALARYPIRFTEEQRAAWTAAAATCGMSLQAWITSALDGEAAKATHVPMVKREGRRG